jgi:hypothetical protein
MLPRAKLTKILIAELAGVPTGAQEVQGTAILKRKDARPTAVRKQSAMTTATQGHQHLLYCVDETQSGSTSYESSYVEGQTSDYYSGHCHPWIRNADGSITIGESLGHTHAIGALSASLAKASPTKNADPAQTGAPTATNKSTRSGTSPESGSNTENTMADQNQIADLTKRNERLERIAKMSGAHKTHFDTLTGEDADAFLAKSAADRDVAIQKAADANPVVFTGEVTGVVVRKSDGDLAKKLAEQNEKNAAELAKSAATIEKAEIVSFAKANMNNIPGDDETHAYIVKSIRKGGGSAELIAKAEAAIKGANAETKVGKKAPGFGGGDPTETDDAPLTKFNVKLAEFAKSKNQTPVEATGAFVETPEGASLYDELLASQH